MEPAEGMRRTDLRDVRVATTVVEQARPCVVATHGSARSGARPQAEACVFLPLTPGSDASPDVHGPALHERAITLRGISLFFLKNGQFRRLCRILSMEGLLRPRSRGIRRSRPGCPLPVAGPSVRPGTAYRLLPISHSPLRLPRLRSDNLSLTKQTQRGTPISFDGNTLGPIMGADRGDNRSQFPGKVRGPGRGTQKNHKEERRSREGIHGWMGAQPIRPTRSEDSSLLLLDLLSSLWISATFPKRLPEDDWTSSVRRNKPTVGIPGSCRFST